MNFKVTESKELYSGKVFDIKVDKILYNSSNSGIREVVVHSGGAVIIPVLPDNKIILVKQYRYPFDKSLFELPAGKLDKNEEPLNCAKRELEEETGYRTDNFTKLGEIYTAPGYCTEILHIFLAKGLIEGNHKREEGEQGMEVLAFPIDAIEKMISSGEIVDAKTICGIFYLKRWKDTD